MWPFTKGLWPFKLWMWLFMGLLIETGLLPEKLLPGKGPLPLLGNRHKSVGEDKAGQQSCPKGQSWVVTQALGL